MGPLGAVACGHLETARAAESILKQGGNAFDAIIAAFLTSCVVEPVLASLGGGGFLLAHTDDQRDVIYDFFAQTPRLPLHKDELDFYPIHADLAPQPRSFISAWATSPRVKDPSLQASIDSSIALWRFVRRWLSTMSTAPRAWMLTAANSLTPIQVVLPLF